ncbi:MAG TPA: DUF1553 domain-containing protein, partial [Verrucomicrobiae bacterium]|nr:DUF1553 domain-containing protein [Verrucomicrobiae bacterium]
CHNHKFDPLTQEEYYRILAFLNNSHEANVKVYSKDDEEQRAAIFAEMDSIEEGLKRATPDWREQMASWESKVRDDQPKWTVVRPEVDDISNGGQKYYLLEDGSFLAQGYAPTRHRVMMTVKTEMKDIRAFRLELLNHPNLPGGGPGRSIFGTAALSEFEVEAAPVSDPEKSEPIWFKRATADVNPPVRELDPKVFPDKENHKRTTGPIDFATDDCEDTAWTIDIGPGRRNEPRNAVFEAGKPVSHEGGTVLTFYLSQRHGGWNSDDNQNNNLGRFRLSITDAAGAEADRVPRHVREILSVAPAMRTPAQERAIFRHWRTTVPKWAEANAEIEKLWARYPEGSKQLVMSEREQMRETSILERGDFLKPKERVDPGVPAFLNPLPATENPTRLDFARWLVDRRSPTTARSIVNRVWQAYFGTGLVPTAENLGTQSEPPSHTG